MATLGQLVTQCGERLDDDAHRRFDQTQLRTWINEGMREAARRTECLIATQVVSLAAATQSATLPTDIVRVHHVTFTPDNDTSNIYPLDYYDLRDMDLIWGTNRTWQSSYPEFYTTWGNPPALEISVAPVPSSGGDLTVYYYRMPAILSTSGGDDGTTVDLPMGWEDVAVEYACALAMRKDRRTDEYQVYMQVFTDKLQALLDTATRYNDTPGQISADLHWSAGGFEDAGYRGYY